MENKTYRILFIGNSATYMNDMPHAIFAGIAEAAGYDPEVHSVTKGGYTLESFADPNDEYGKRIDRLLRETKFDCVVIQELTVRPASESAEKFYSAVRFFVKRARENGAVPVLFDTTARKEGHPMLKERGWTNESMTWKVAAAYEKAGRTENAEVAYVGLAFLDINKNHPEIDLYAEDMAHSSYKGSLLAALTIFGTVFKIDPTSVPFKGEVSEREREILALAAKKAAFDPPDIPEEYRIK